MTRVLEIIRELFGFEPWPSHHRELSKLVTTRIATLDKGTWACALRSYRLPAGKEETIWLFLRENDGNVSYRVTQFSHTEIDVEHKLTRPETVRVKEDLVRLGAFDLSHSRNPARLEWACAIVTSDGQRNHAIQTLNPNEPHLSLIRYLINLASTSKS